VSDLALAAVLMETVLLASTISVELGLSVALIELLAGVVVGNAAHVDIPSWLTFIGSFAGIVLTFQAGAEVDLPQLRREWTGSTGRGGRARSAVSRFRRRVSQSSTRCSWRPGSIASSSASG